MDQVFVVDDQIYIRRLIQMGLEEKGYIVVDFPNGTKLMNYINDPLVNPIPDVILLDIMMPDMDGFEILEELKKHPEYENIPVIMISARNQKDDVLKALKMGANDFIVKPFDIEKVEDKIQNVINE